MGRSHLERLFAGLDAGFAAAVVSEEGVAADDLAFSLSQDLAVPDDLARSGGSLLIEGVAAPVDRVGHDFLAAGPWLAPLDRAMVDLGGSRPALPLPDVFLAVLRRLARAGSEVAVGCAEGAYQGRVVRASSSHLVIDGPRKVGIPLARVDYVRLVRAGSADAL
jgi:hypothetical protein